MWSLGRSFGSLESDSQWGVLSSRRKRNQLNVLSKRRSSWIAASWLHHIATFKGINACDAWACVCVSRENVCVCVRECVLYFPSMCIFQSWQFVTPSVTTFYSRLLFVNFVFCYLFHFLVLWPTRRGCLFRVVDPDEHGTTPTTPDVTTLTADYDYTRQRPDSDATETRLPTSWATRVAWASRD